MTFDDWKNKVNEKLIDQYGIDIDNFDDKVFDNMFKDKESIDYVVNYIGEKYNLIKLSAYEYMYG